MIGLSVRPVGKKWLSPFYNTYSCTNCSSLHDLQMPYGGLCPWPLFHAWVTKTQNGNSGAPVMVPITLMSSFCTVNENFVYKEIKLSTVLYCQLEHLIYTWFICHIHLFYSNMMIPGNSVSIARQFLRCVLHQLAPNGIFPMLFQSSFEGNYHCM